jgi:hypothetical protein
LGCRAPGANRHHNAVRRARPRINATNNGGTYSYALLGGTAPGGFAAFCIEPMEFVSVGTQVNYNVVQLSRAAIAHAL